MCDHQSLDPEYKVLTGRFAQWLDDSTALSPELTFISRSVACL